MKKIILSIVFAGTMLIGNANPPAQEDPCFQFVADIADKAASDNPDISQEELTDIMNAAYLTCSIFTA